MDPKYSLHIYLAPVHVHNSFPLHVWAILSFAYERRWFLRSNSFLSLFYSCIPSSFLLFRIFLLLWSAKLASEVRGICSKKNFLHWLSTSIHPSTISIHPSTISFSYLFNLSMKKNNNNNNLSMLILFISSTRFTWIWLQIKLFVARPLISTRLIYSYQ